MIIRSKLIVLAVVLALALAVGCGEDEDPASGGGNGGGGSKIETPAVLEEAGQLTACTDMTYPPITFVQENKPAGVDVDFGTRLAELMDTRAEFSQTGFPGIIAALQAGKCDVILAGLNVSEERRGEIDFVIYAQATQTFMVNKDDEGRYSSIEDFGGETVGVQVGSTNLQFLQEKNEELPKPIEIKPFPQDRDAVSSLRSGALDAYFADNAVVAYYESQNPDQFVATDVTLNPIPYGIGLRKDDDELQRALQQGVDMMYETGEAQAILDKWRLGEKGYRQAQ